MTDDMKTPESPKSDGRPERLSLNDSLHADMPAVSDTMDLVQRYQAGEESAMDALLERYQERIRRVVRIRLGTKLREKVESMDIVNDVNMVVFDKLREFEPRGQGSLLNWLSQIALNQIRDQHKYFFVAERRNANREVPMDAPRSPDDSSPGFDPSDSADQLPEERAWNSELREILDECMTKLPENYQEIILLRDYCGMSWSEVAEESGKPTEGAAQEMHRRAWIKLRRAVRPKLGGIM